MATTQVTILLDSKAQGTGIQATIQGLGRVQTAVAGLGSSLGGFLDRYMGRLAAVVTAGALARFGKQAIESADALAKNAQAAGQSVDQFARLAYAGDLARASQETLITASKYLSEWLQRSGESGKDLTQALLEQADTFAAMADGPDKVRLAVERFGRSGQQLLPLLNQGSAAIRAQMLEAEQFGAVVGPELAKNAQQFNDNLTRMTVAARGVANTVLDRVLPALIAMQEEFLSWVKSSGVIEEAADLITDAFQRVAVGLATVSGLVSGVKQGTAATGTLLGTLFGGGTLDEALRNANEQITLMDDYVRSVERIMRLPKSSSTAGAGGAATGPAAATEKEALEFLLRENQMYIEQLKLRREISEQERREQEVGLLGVREDLLMKRWSLLSRAAGPMLTEGMEVTHQYAEAYNELAAAMTEMEKVQERINELQSESSFVGRMRDGIRELRDEWVQLGTAVADVMLNGIKRSIDAVADGIWAVVDGTMTWGQLFAQVARGIISDLIRIVLQWIVSQTIMRLLSALFSKTVAATTSSTAASAAAAWAPAATLASIATMGGASGAGTAALAAALAAGVAMASAGSIAGGAVSAFAEGGVVGGPEQFIRVNERGTESVLNAGATAMVGNAGVDLLNYLGSRGLERGFASGLEPMDGSGREARVSIILVDSRNAQAAKDFLASSEGKTVVADVVRERKLDVGVPA